MPAFHALSGAVVLEANCFKHEAQLLRNDGYLTLFYSSVLLTVPVTTNVDSAVVRVDEAPQRDNQADPSPVTGRPVSPN